MSDERKPYWEKLGRNSEELIAYAKSNGWEWDTVVPGAWYHPERKIWTHLLDKAGLELVT